ncbi:MAG: hypothetical protein F4121_09450 [Acidimicrobiia bacterium]|nr:hypothetical protein [Acidimicrobiia bacterium]MYC46611.1 hypothetical protein [Acidimicrobiia bacterium]MYI20272.1 hypothetical protein [Acidimicrobiia bacterium]
MIQIRHLIRPLAVVALLATSLALAVASPAGAQSDIDVFEFHNGEADADADDWEVQITAQALGGCNPEQARPGYVTAWIGPDDEDGEVLDPGTCNYRITAVARKTDAPNRLCNAELGWGASPGTWGPSLTTKTRPPDEDVVTARHTGGATPNCSARPTLSITIDPEEVIQELPVSATDSNLEARAERAAEITEFRVKVTPESSTANRTGCDQTLDFFVLGDGEAAEKALGSLGAGVECDFRITVTEAPPPFAIIDANGEPFKTTDRDADGEIDIDLSDHVQLPYNRIVIIQDVINNPGNQGRAAYKLSTTCGGVPALPPIAIGTGGGGSGIFTLPGGDTVATLANGRFTVHSPTFANFGAGASYPAIATSITSDEIAGCSVTASIELDAPGCTLGGSDARTLTWSSANPIRNFDFEFDIYCGGSRPPDPPPTPTTQPPATDDDTDTVEDEAAAESGTDTVRIVAQLLENGKIEFGLQQWQHDSTWGARMFPRARLFPPTTTVGRWLVSSAITLNVAESADTFDEEVTVRIVARRGSDDRVEFGLQQSDDGGDTWGERILPSRRFFPAAASVLRWLGSSNITVDS